MKDFHSEYLITFMKESQLPLDCSRYDHDIEYLSWVFCMARSCNINRFICTKLALYAYSSSYMYLTLSYTHRTCNNFEITLIKLVIYD